MNDGGLGIRKINTHNQASVVNGYGDLGRREIAYGGKLLSQSMDAIPFRSRNRLEILITSAFGNLL